MIIKTASIELSRNYNKLIIIGLHPGTVSTKLSKPYIKSAKNVFEAEQSAKKLITVIDNLDYISTGRVFDYSEKLFLTKLKKLQQKKPQYIKKYNHQYKKYL